jgi:putative ATP-binding cassette transporter
MILLRLLLSDIQTSKRRLFFMIALSGLTNAGLLAVINAAADTSSKTTGHFMLVLGFVALMGLYVASQRFIMITAAGEIETMIHRIRVRLMDKLLRCELLDVETIGRAKLQAGLGHETQTLSQFATTLVLAGQATVLVVFGMGYLGWLSFPNFALCVLYLLVILTLYFRRTKKITDGLHMAGARENDLQDALTDLLDGFKELKMDNRRKCTIQREAEIISDDASWKRIGVQIQMTRNFVFSQSAFFMLLAVTVFIVPMFSSASAASAAKTITTILFLSGPISGLMACVPAFASANASAENIVALERHLSELLEQSERVQKKGPGVVVESAPHPIALPFKHISFENVYFSHDTPTASHGFVVGPINLTLNAGETTFITGGNGSGKSTLLKLLTALYRPQSGTIRIDGIAIGPHNAQQYRDLFSTVFSDYHLFSRLYGLPLPEEDEMHQRLADFELADKTGVDGDRFRTLDLSSGQRRRLALLIAQLEHKPICVLDEWAADQDPLFRRKFYQEILPAMQALGVTIIAVTHDDRYFGVCDRHIRMDEGRINENEDGIHHV